MREIHAAHLIIGAGLLGLSVADQLLRRGEKNIVILDRRNAPVGFDQCPLEPVLLTGLPEYAPHEARGLELLEEAPSYLSISPAYRRCGSLTFPVLLETESTEILPAQEACRRFPQLVLPEDESLAFQPADGGVDAAAVSAALLSEVRRRGGHIVWNCELAEIADEENSLRFSATSRSGSARRIYLTAGAAIPRLLAGMGIPCDYTISTWHVFELGVPAGPSFLLRFEQPPTGTVFHSGEQQLWIFIPAPANSAADEALEPRLDWQRVQDFRAHHMPELPMLEPARMRRGTATARLDLAPRAPGILSHFGGRLLAAGAFGAHAFPLAQAIAEELATLGSRGSGGGEIHGA